MIFIKKTGYVLIVVLRESNRKALLMDVKTSMQTKTSMRDKSEGDFRTKFKLVLQQQY